MYKYSLHKKSIKHHCPNCNKKRFVRYIDNETQEYISSKVGRCDREINCGYHYTPKHFFGDNNLEYNPRWKKKNIIIEEIRKPTFHTQNTLNRTLNNYAKNNFISSLYSKFLEHEVINMINQYKIGTAYFWHDGTIFWQIDAHNNIRGGKIIKYQKNGKRTKYINWVHSYLLKQKIIKTFHLSQCLFGEHLINNSNKIIAIVESEKTACIMSILFDKYLWLACGSLSGINNEKMKVLRYRKFVLYPDLGNNSNNKTPYYLWKIKCEELKKIGFDISISDLLEQNSTQKQREKGLDIADFFTENLNEKPKRITTKQNERLLKLYTKNKNSKNTY